MHWRMRLSGEFVRAPPIEIWSFRVFHSVTADVSIANVVHENDDHAWVWYCKILARQPAQSMPDKISLAIYHRNHY
jgi:hypothetical protein